MSINYETQVQEELKKQNMNIFAQSFSTDGKYLATGNNFGIVAIYHMSGALSSSANENSFKPIFKFKVFDGAVYTMVSTDSVLICAGWGDIKAYKWTDILQKEPKVVWLLRVPHLDNLGGNETNAMVLNPKDQTLYSGGGDGIVYSWDLETGTNNRSYTGHKDYIQALSLFHSSDQLASAAEDGSVRIWDTRTPGQAVALMEPFKNEECSQASNKRWLGCVQVSPSDDWLVCGGGPSLALWHLRSLAPTTVFDAPQCHAYSAHFNEDTVISAGSTPHVYHWNLSGSLKNQVPCSSTTIYNIEIHQGNGTSKVMCASGSSSQVDVYTNFGYRAFSLDFS
ncbi:THO complex subunit 6 homolog [Apostichopus japonicus]|uniref:THO complex subunit 6 homolog n=1 Tax=Stichopus japonicus TaxID=307972 RepID=UPI003AB1BED0